MINLVPDLIKKTAAHKLVWVESQNRLCNGYGTYYANIVDSFSLRLSIDKKEVTLEITRINAGHNDGVVGKIDSTSTTLKSKEKKALRRLYNMAVLLSPSNASSTTGKLSERFHRILRAL